jgi:hypothetical protein
VCRFGRFENLRDGMYATEMIFRNVSLTKFCSGQLRQQGGSELLKLTSYKNLEQCSYIRMSCSILSGVSGNFLNLEIDLSSKIQTNKWDKQKEDELCGMELLRNSWCTTFCRFFFVLE